MKRKYQRDSSLFDYPSKTTIPLKLSKKWEDCSWHNDASACCWLKVPTKKNPKAVLVLWVQPDDKAEWELPEWELPDWEKFQLDWMADSSEGWSSGTGDRTVLSTSDYTSVTVEIKKQIVLAQRAKK